jgi:hypothetical protein
MAVGGTVVLSELFLKGMRTTKEKSNSEHSACEPRIEPGTSLSRGTNIIQENLESVLFTNINTVHK